MVAERKMLDRFVLFLIEEPSPEEVIQFSASAAESARISYLTNQKKNGQVTREEELEIEDYMRTEHLVRMAKLKAMSKIKGTAA